MGAIQLKFKAQEITKSFNLIDLTGSHSKENPGGWGGPNPRIEDVISSLIEIEGPNMPSQPNFDPINAILNTPPGSNPYVAPNANGTPVGSLTPLTASLQLAGSFPNKKDLGYQVTPYVIGGVSNTKIVSGKWTIRWTVSGVDLYKKPFKYQTMLVVVFINDVTCCVDKATQNTNRYAFNDLKQRAIIEMGVLLRAAYKSRKCGNYDEADLTIRFLNEQCQCTTC